MDIERTDRVSLPIAEDRCSADDCAMGEACARRRSQIPKGAVLRDFSRGIETYVKVFGCVSFVSCKRKSGAAATPRRVFPPLGS
jgi:hypothetical protein